MVTLNAWLSRELDKLRASGGAGFSMGKAASSKHHGVLTPQARQVDPGKQGDPDKSAAAPTGDAATRDSGTLRARVDVARGGHDRESGEPRITDPLRTVVTRARWKASACRLALDQREAARGEAAEAAPSKDQIAARERSLRTRLQSLPDTSAWMLDLPFGTRVSESGAFDVGEEQVERMQHVADCYETLALGAEVAIDLEEHGAFRNGPVPAFLYLMAEAQSALLHSLQDAPTRTDSDQRDVFLWLKELTTRFRIYVDRHMRLDDPASVTGSRDLSERIRRSAREILEARRARRERGQVLNKIRYHVRKLMDTGPLREPEVESLEAALDRWVAGGNSLSDRSLVELFQSLHARVEGTGVGASVAETDAAGDEAAGEAAEGGDGVSARLARLLQRIPRTTAPGGGSPSHSSAGARDVAGRGSRGTADDASASTDAIDDAERAAKHLEEARSLLDKRRIVLITDDASQVESDALAEELGAAAVEVVEVAVDGDETERWALLDEQLAGDGVDLLLLGVRLTPDDYQRFKESCLAGKKPFVRLPGTLAASAIAHQIMRQVGWRLRAQRDQATPS